MTSINMFTCSKCSRLLFSAPSMRINPSSFNISLQRKLSFAASTSRRISQQKRLGSIPDVPPSGSLGNNPLISSFIPKRWWRKSSKATTTSDSQFELGSSDGSSAGRPQLEDLSQTSSHSSVIYLESGFPLPVCCPGCGAYAQISDPTLPGYYGKTRKKTRQAIQRSKEAFNEFQIRNNLIRSEETAAGRTDQLGRLDTGPGEQQKGNTTTGPPIDGHSSHKLLNGGREVSLTGKFQPSFGFYQGVNFTYFFTDADYIKVITAAAKNPDLTNFPSQVCDRCHNLQHHGQGMPSISPTLESVHAYLDESPHSTNRVYHIIDAADFPLSVLPNVFDALELQEQRSRNRRSKTERYIHGKKMTKVDFIITRSDLLAATKDQVDSMMTYFRKTIAQVVGLEERKKDERNVYRLGNIHLVSSHRGWWTKEVKDYMREHGGGVWMVGKVNVGKSSFIQSCFPKDSRDLEKVADILITRQQEEQHKFAQNPSSQDAIALKSEDSLLPPIPREELYPTLPVVSSLPGTTVSPIRIPFGRGKGEMIDLPGLGRNTLQEFVKDEYKLNLIMTKRVVPKECLRIKSQQSLLLGGGLVRITPVTDDPNLVFMAACFVPLNAHITRTEKAIEIQAGKREIHDREKIKDEIFENSSQSDSNHGLLPDYIAANPKFGSAGIFQLSTDVTSNHLPTGLGKYLQSKDSRKSDIRHQLEDLPYRVLSTDILIEGSGWIELTVQIRSKRSSPTAITEFPAVEVFSPYGKCIGSRPPLQSWVMIQERDRVEKRKRGGRSRNQNIGLQKRAQVRKVIY